jgi:hypothetical protein
MYIEENQTEGLPLSLADVLLGSRHLRFYYDHELATDDHPLIGDAALYLYLRALGKTCDWSPNNIEICCSSEDQQRNLEQKIRAFNLSKWIQFRIRDEASSVAAFLQKTYLLSVQHIAVSLHYDTEAFALAVFRFGDADVRTNILEKETRITNAYFRQFRVKKAICPVETPIAITKKQTYDWFSDYITVGEPTTFITYAPIGKSTFGVQIKTVDIDAQSVFCAFPFGFLYVFAMAIFNESGARLQNELFALRHDKRDQATISLPDCGYKTFGSPARLPPYGYFGKQILPMFSNLPPAVSLSRFDLIVPPSMTGHKLQVVMLCYNVKHIDGTYALSE